METKFYDVRPDQMVFHQKLHHNENAMIFRVSVSNFECVMKVHRARPGRFNIHQREVTAYRRLHERGVTEKGCVPRFYGSVEKIQPELWQPHLDAFADDQFLPSAIFIEHIPGMSQLHLDTFTRDRMAKFVEAVRAITAALVMHNDLKPRNFMIAPGALDRVGVLDFDRADTFDEQTITAEQREWLREDVEIVEDLARFLELDVAEGRLNRSYLSFCT